MPRTPEASILLITVAIALIVIGTGSVVGGVTKMYASQQWEDSGAGDLANCPFVETSTGNYDFRCPDNPYDGGGIDLLIGLVLSLLGGTGTFYGTR